MLPQRTSPDASRLPTRGRLPFFLLTLLCALSVAPDVVAQLKDAAGSKDHPMIKRYEGSVIIGYDFKKFNDYVVLLGPVTGGGIGKMNVLSATKSERVEGQVTRILYVAPEGRSPLEVLRNYEQELQKSGFQTLYKCARKECGTDQDGWLGEYYLYKDDRELRNTPPAGSGGPPGQVSEYALSGAISSS